MIDNFTNNFEPQPGIGHFCSCHVDSVKAELKLRKTVKKTKYIVDLGGQWGQKGQ